MSCQLGCQLGHVHTQREVWWGEDEEDLHSQRQEDVEGGKQDIPAHTHIWNPGCGGATEWVESSGSELYSLSHITQSGVTGKRWGASPDREPESARHPCLLPGPPGDHQ